MAGPIDNNGPIIPGINPNSVPVERPSGLSQDEQVSAGFSGRDSSEVVGAPVLPTSTQSEQVSLDLPESSGDEVPYSPATPSSSILEGLRETVRNFNANFDIDTIDLADTTTLLSMIKGMTSDMRALSGAENIDSAFKALETKYDDKISTAKDLVGAKNDLKDKKSLKLNKETQLTTASDELAAKRSELSAAADKDKVALRSDVAQLEAKVGSLSAEVEDLNSGIVSLTKKINTGEYDLKNDIDSDLENLHTITNGIRTPATKTDRKTGEAKKVAALESNALNSVEHGRQSEKLIGEKKYMQNLAKEQVEVQKQKTPTASAREIKDAQMIARILGDTTPKSIIKLLKDNNATVPPKSGGGDFFGDLFGGVSDFFGEVSDFFTKTSDGESKFIDSLYDRGILVRYDTPEKVEDARKDGSLDEASRTLKSIIDSSNIDGLTKEQELKESENNKDIKEGRSNESSGESKSPVTSALSTKEFLRKMNALRIETEALGLLAKAERDRLATEGAISKSTLV